MGASMRVPLLPRGHPGETVGVMFCNKRMWQKASALVKTQICDRIMLKEAELIKAR